MTEARTPIGWEVWSYSTIVEDSPGQGRREARHRAASQGHQRVLSPLFRHRHEAIAWARAWMRARFGRVWL